MFNISAVNIETNSNIYDTKLKIPSDEEETGSILVWSKSVKSRLSWMWNDKFGSV